MDTVTEQLPPGHVCVLMMFGGKGAGGGVIGLVMSEQASCTAARTMCTLCAAPSR